nr:hemolysin family protein [Streptomyces spiramenti]
MGVVVILVIIAANGYFVAQEFAYMTVDRERLGARADAGDAAARRALRVTRRTSFMLSGAQLGITVTGLLVGFVAEPLIGGSFGVLLGGVGVPVAVGVSIGTVVALVTATVVQMIFGELYPKNLAIADPEPLARALAPSTLVYLAACGWLITVFDRAANAFLRLLRTEPVHDLDTSATREDLRHAVSDSRDSGDLPADLSLLVDRVLDFPDRPVEHAMVPRARVDTVTPETTVAELRAMMARAHSRYPVIDAHGEPVGVVHLVDLLRRRPTDAEPVRAVMRPALLLPVLLPLPEALAQMARTRDQLGCVLDEYGAFVGILTVEDLAEELIGDISDEHDPGPPTAVVAADGDRWRIDGDTHIDEVARAIDRELPTGEYETLAGLLIKHRGALPQPGETIRIPLPDDPADLVLEQPVRRLLEAEVLELARRVPSLLLVRVVEEPGGVEDADGASGPQPQPSPGQGDR